MFADFRRCGTARSRLSVALSCALCGLPVAALAQADAGDASVIELDNIVVSATGFEQHVEDAPASISVIGRQELEKKAFKDVTDALQDVPGVVVTGGGSSSDISVRGMAPQYTMILVDGKRQSSRETRPNSDGPGIEQGWLPPMQAIERIEVIRGPMSSLYGSDAMGGVVNIITRKVPEKWTGSVRGEVTVQGDRDSGDRYETNVYLAGPLVEDTLGMQVYGQKSRRQEDRIINGFNKHDKTSGTVKFALTPNADHDLEAEFSRTLQERLSVPGKSTPVLNNRGQPNELSRNQYTRNHYGLTHTGRWGNATSTTYIQREKTDNPSRDMFLKNTEFNTQWTMPLGDHVLTAGFHYQKENLKDGGNEFEDSTVDRLSRYQWALFAEDEWFITDDFALTTGLRMTRDENYGTHWTPRLYGVWHATEKFSIKGGVSTGFKAPALRHAVADWGQATGGPGGNAVIMGNPDLKPEKSVSQELALVWDNREDLTSSLTFFNTDFKDKITELDRCLNCSATPGGHTYDFIRDRVNVDRAVIRGAEATSTWQMRDDLRLSASYTYTYSRQKTGDFAGKPLNKMPKHMANASLDWDVNERLGLWSRINFRGRTSNYLSRTSMSHGTPSYTFVDAGLNYQVNKNVDLGVGIYNLFDKRVTYDDFDMVHDGRRYWAQMTVSF